MKTIARCVVVILLPALISCNSLGSDNILSERIMYNDAVQYTNAQQTLANIVRISKSENPAFGGPTEITDNSTAAGSANGGSSSIAGPSAIGMLTAMISYTKQPIVKYSVTNGNDLIQQFSTPILLSDIFNLSNSNASLVPLFMLSFNNLTPKFVDYYEAVGLINALDNLGAVRLELGTLPNEPKFAKSSSGLIQAPPGNSKSATSSDKMNTVGDILEIKFRPVGIVAMPTERSPEDQIIKCYGSENKQAVAQRFWTKLSRIYGQDRKSSILLHAANSGKAYAAVLPRTAQGALGISGDGHSIKFFTPEQVASTIQANQKTEDDNCRGDFYFTGNNDKVMQMWHGYYRQLSSQSNGDEDARVLREYGEDTTLILVQTSKEPLDNTYVSYKRKDMYYSIRDDDEVSKKNFSLLATISLISAKSVSPTQTVTALTLR